MSEIKPNKNLFKMCQNCRERGGKIRKEEFVRLCESCYLGIFKNKPSEDAIINLEVKND